MSESETSQPTGLERRYARRSADGLSQKEIDNREKWRLHAAAKRRESGLAPRKAPQSKEEKNRKDRERVRLLGTTPRDPAAVKRAKENYHNRNREKINAKVRQKYAEFGPKQRTAEQKERYARVQRKRSRDQYQQALLVNPETIRSRGREAAKKSYHKDLKRARSRAVVAASKRRARELAAEGSHGPADIANLYVKQGGKCATCRTEIRDDGGPKKFHVDHVDPLVKGGRNSVDNLALLCRVCNLSKHDKDPIEWANKHGLLFI